MKKVVRITVSLVLGVFVIASGAWYLTGTIYLGADKPHWEITNWLLHGSMERSVKHHAKSLPPPLMNEDLIKAGVGLFHSMCVTCHGAPGFGPSEIGQGLMPAPPSLQISLYRWKPAEIYWIIEHGIKMTGMPAFGPTHSKKELNSIVVFLQKFPTMSKAEYDSLLAGVGSEKGKHDPTIPAHGHGHDAEGGPHMH